MLRYRRLLAYARPHARAFAAIVGLSLLGSALVALQPWPVKVIVDTVLQDKPLPSFLARGFEAVGWRPERAALLLIMALGGLAVTSTYVLTESLLAWKWTRAGRRMVFDLAEDLFARLQRRSILFHSRNAVGDTMNTVARDSWCVYLLLDTVLITPVHSILAVVAMAILMAGLDSTLALVALALAPLMVLASFIVGKPLRAAARLKREIEGRMTSHLQQTLSGMPVVQAFVQEDREHERFQRFADAAIRAQQRSTLLGSVNSLSSGLVTALGTAAILWIGAHRVLEGNLTIGSLLVFVAYLGSLQVQMKTFATAWTTVQSLSASLDRAAETLEATPEVQERPGAVALTGIQGEIDFENVSFAYEARRPVLQDISLRVAPGETIAIVGETGAGKSTLVNLIPRMFDPTAGTVRIDGRDLRDVQIQSLRRQVALVLQEPFLSPETIADNIAFGRPEATRAEIEAAARAANAHEFIAQLPEGYSTRLEERGATLSGGEKQRLAIARALLKDAPILILDEPTSALDSATERDILNALDRLMRGRTTFIIAHRLSTVRRADRIIVLDRGRIAESGSHISLLAEGRLYAHLHQSQFGINPAVPAVTGPA